MFFELPSYLKNTLYYISKINKPCVAGAMEIRIDNHKLHLKSRREMDLSHTTPRTRDSCEAVRHDNLSAKEAVKDIFFNKVTFVYLICNFSRQWFKYSILTHRHGQICT